MLGTRRPTPRVDPERERRPCAVGRARRGRACLLQGRAPWEVAEYGMTLVEYVLKRHTDAALAEFYFEPGNGWYIPDLP